MFNFHTDASDKQLDVVISQNNKPISLLFSDLFLIRSKNPQNNYTTTEKELLPIV